MQRVKYSFSVFFGFIARTRPLFLLPEYNFCLHSVRTGLKFPIYTVIISIQYVRIQNEVGNNERILKWDRGLILLRQRINAL